MIYREPLRSAVMPAYNERTIIAEIVRRWRGEGQGKRMTSAAGLTALRVLLKYRFTG